MGTKTRYALLLSVLVLISIVFSACAPKAAPAETDTTTYPAWATASCNRGDQTVVIDQKTVDCAEVLGGKAPNNVSAPAPKPVETGKNGSETAGDPTPSAAATNVKPSWRDFTAISLKCICVSTALDQTVSSCSFVRLARD